MEIVSYILADTVSRPPRPYNGYVQWNQKPSYLLCFTEKYLYFNTVINSLIIIKTLTCKIPPNLPFAKGRNYPSLAKGSTRLTILSLSKERATCLREAPPCGAKAGGDFSILPLGYGEMKAGDS